MRKYFVLAALAFAAIVSCQKEIAPAEEPVAGIPDGYVELTLTANSDVATKSFLDGKTVTWEPGEEVAVFTDVAVGINKFTVSSVEGSNVVIYGTVPAGATSFTAIYPYDSAVSLNYGVAKIQIPREQKLAEGGTIAPDALCSVAVFPDASTKAQFKNVVSLLSFQVATPEDIDAVSFTSKAEGMEEDPDTEWNLLSVEVSANADPVITNVAGGFKTKVIAAGAFSAEATYCAAVPPCELMNGISVGVCKGSKTAFKVSEKQVELARNAGFNLGNVVPEDATYKVFQIADCYDLIEFLADAPDYAPGDEVEVVSDIDMLDIEVKTAESFAGILNGGYHRLKNWTSEGVSLFSLVTGEIRDFTIDESCSLHGCPAGRFGYMVCALEGKMTNCHNEADITFELNGGEPLEDETLGTLGRQFGGLCGRMTLHSAQMIDCSNSGDITASSVLTGNMDGSLYIGGVVGLVGDPGEDVVVRLQGCSNTGNITYSAESTDIPAGWLSSHFIGGVAGGTGLNRGSDDKQSGYTLYYGEIRECTNEGDVDVTWGGGTGGYYKVGGVIGAGECALFDCVNKGAVSYKNSMDTANAGPSVGGIAGSLGGQAPVSASNCVNFGEVGLSGMFSNAGSSYAGGLMGIKWANAGGCFGLVGDNTTLIEDCHNKGPFNVNAVMTSTGGSASAFGGVVGVAMCEVKDCSFICGDASSISGMTVNCHMGGIVGYSYKPVSGCSVNADMSFSHDIETLTTRTKIYNNVGGIIGYALGTTDTVKDCTVAGSMTVLATAELRLGGVVGMSYVNMLDCENSADITLTRKLISDASLKSYIGGVVGLHNQEGTELTNLSNSGTLDIKMDEKSPYSDLGGCIGYTKSNKVTGCSNTGDIIFDGGNMVKQMSIGGVIGWMQVAITVDSCYNGGNITAGNWVNTAYNYIGGVTGQYNAANNTWTNCSNTGDIVSTVPSKMCIGGICSSINATKFEGCSSSGNITASNCLAASRIGGVAGYWGKGAMVNATATGEINVTAQEGQAAAFVGGALGALNVDSSWQDCTITGAVTSSGFDAGCLLGQFSASGKTLTLAEGNTLSSTVNGAEASIDNAVGSINGGTVTGW